MNSVAFQVIAMQIGSSKNEANLSYFNFFELRIGFSIK